jgi:lipopolysaccharide transport system ATP-binding protein
MRSAISIDGVSKRYRIGRADRQASYGYRTLRETLVRLAYYPIRRWRDGRGVSSTEDFWALRDISFDIHPGEVVGIIGRNGAGKSTLLKILSRITKPTLGEVSLRGRVGSLLEVGTGFHPELTGRENIYLNGSILGMKRREINRQFDAIVAFAGIDQFLDTPIKRYSSGMYVRLAFAVAAHLEPEILIVDEVLAVGDQAFQKKCIGRMGEIATSGRTVLLVSHDLPMLAKLSTHAVWLESGQVKDAGTPGDIIERYCEAATRSGGSTARVSLIEHAGRKPGMVPLLATITLRDADGNLTTAVPLGGTLIVEIEFAHLAGRSDHTMMLDVCDVFGTLLGRAHSKVHSSIDLSGVQEARARCIVNDIRFIPGEYTLNAAIGDSSNNLDRVENAIGFTVLSADIYGTGKTPPRKDGPFALAAHWEMQP